MAEAFRNEILNITPTAPGWQVYVKHEASDTKTRKSEVEHRDYLKVIAWALVRVWYVDGASSTEIEPVFISGGRPINATEYRRLHSDINPSPGDPKVTIAIDVQAVE